MYDPVMIKVKAATLTIDTVEQFFVEVSDREKPEALARVLKEERPEQAIIFVRTKIGADRLNRSLNDKGLRVKALHGDMSQGSRDGVMISFKDGREQAARGHRHRRARARHLGRQPRHQLRPAELARGVRAPDRAHRPRRPLGARDHARHRRSRARTSTRSASTRTPRSPSGRANGGAPPREGRHARRPPLDAPPEDAPPSERRAGGRPRQSESRRPRRTKPRAGQNDQADRRRRAAVRGLEPADVVSRDRGQLAARRRGRAERAHARAVQLRRGPARPRGGSCGKGQRHDRFAGVPIKLEVAGR